MRKRWLVTIGVSITFVLATTMVRAEIKVQTVDYKIGNSEFEGYLAYDPGKQGKQAAVVIYPAGPAFRTTSVNTRSALLNSDSLSASLLRWLRMDSFAVSVCYEGDVSTSHRGSGSALSRTRPSLSRSRPLGFWHRRVVDPCDAGTTWIDQNSLLMMWSLNPSNTP